MRNWHRDCFVTSWLDGYHLALLLILIVTLYLHSLLLHLQPGQGSSLQVSPFSPLLLPQLVTIKHRFRPLADNQIHCQRTRLRHLVVTQLV